MTNEKKRLYWDSCVFIDFLQKTPDRYPILEKIVSSAKNGELKIVTSTLAIVEVTGCGLTRPTPPDVVKRIAAFFENDFIAMRQVDRPTVELAAEIARQHSIKPPDAIHIATAIRAGVPVLQTYDGAKDQPPIGKKKMLYYDSKFSHSGGLPLRISIPAAPNSPQMELQFTQSIGPVSKEQALDFVGERFRRKEHIHPLRQVISLWPENRHLSRRW